MKRHFAGDDAADLPLRRAGSSDPAWWHVMGYDNGPPGSLAQVERQFRRLAALAHPDRGGDRDQLQRLLRARAQARSQLRR